MSVRRDSRPRYVRPAVVAASLAAAAAGVALVERRHLREIAADPEFLALSEPLGGTALAPIVSADGTTLHAERFGAGDTDGEHATLVLAHGWTEELAYWGPVIRRLAAPRLAPNPKGLSIVAYDLRGHGASAVASDGDYSLERFGEDLEAVLAAVGTPPERTAVAGHSLGGMSIAAWAQAFDVDRRVAAAALINTGLSDLIGGALVLGEIGARLAPQWVSRSVLGSARPMLPVSTPLSAAAARHIAFGPDAGAGTVAYYERMLMRTEASARSATGIALSRMDLSAAVARITVPTLVIAGDRDRLTPPVHAQRIVDSLPAPAGLTILDRTGHMSPLERPAEVADALTALLHRTGVMDG
jgi:pimeloyl-ACP methyl ester carboxylesterase